MPSRRLNCSPTALAAAPANASINATNGLLTWVTSEADAGTSNDFLVIVSDNGIPELLDGQWFTVFVGSASPATNTGWSMLKLPDTGQSNRYTSTFGQDADYTINPPSFTDNGDGTVTDNVTGLIWQKADGGEMTWSNAVLYAQTNRVGGQSDWRLPTSHEAFSILNHGRVNPALDTNFFTLSTAQYWWTADSQVADATRVWAINAGGGIGAHRQTETLSAGGTNRYHVRCVRGTAAATTWTTHSGALCHCRRLFPAPGASGFPAAGEILPAALCRLERRPSIQPAIVYPAGHLRRGALLADELLGFRARVYHAPCSLCFRRGRLETRPPFRQQRQRHNHRPRYRPDLAAGSRRVPP